MTKRRKLTDPPSHSARDVEFASVSPGKSSTHCTVVWCLLDGKPGHENQSRGLIAALSERRPLDVHFIRAPSVWSAGRDFLGNRFPPGDSLSNPQIIIAAGHMTHAAALAARRKHGGRLVLLMRPSLPMSWFDLCLVPEHDLPPGSIGDLPSNVVSTRGVLNNVKPASAKDFARGLLLVGGPSTHHNWDDQAVIQQVQRIVTDSREIRWTLTTSRRTPPSFLPGFGNGLSEELDIRPCEHTPAGWLATQLATSGNVFVTEDSVSMIYEALSAGSDVGLLNLPRRRTSRIVRGVDRLIEERLVVPFDHWQQHRFEHRQHTILQEADRCADIVCERFLDAA